MRLVVDLSTEFLKDRFCIPIKDKEYTIKKLHKEIQSRYSDWHAFKVYSFDIFSKNGKDCAFKNL